MIYYILDVTQNTHISYVGHSQGTLIAFVEFGNLSNPVQNNVSFYAALAPIAKVGHQKTPLKYLDTDSKELEHYWHKLFGREDNAVDRINFKLIIIVHQKTINYIIIKQLHQSILFIQ